MTLFEVDEMDYDSECEVLLVYQFFVYSMTDEIARRLVDKFLIGRRVTV